MAICTGVLKSIQKMMSKSKGDKTARSEYDVTQKLVERTVKLFPATNVAGELGLDVCNLALLFGCGVEGVNGTVAFCTE